MVKLRLKRIGRRKSPFYRLVAIDSRKRRDGREIERLGWYNPIRPGLEADLNEDRIKHWLSEGAIPSATVHNLLTKKGINFMQRQSWRKTTLLCLFKWKDNFFF